MHKEVKFKDPLNIELKINLKIHSISINNECIKNDLSGFNSESNMYTNNIINKEKKERKKLFRK